MLVFKNSRISLVVDIIYELCTRILKLQVLNRRGGTLNVVFSPDHFQFLPQTFSFCSGRAPHSITVYTLQASRLTLTKLSSQEPLKLFLGVSHSRVQSQSSELYASSSRLTSELLLEFTTCGHPIYCTEDFHSDRRH